MSSSGEQFLQSVDTSGAKKNVLYLASILEKFIEQVGPTNAVQLTIDNKLVNLVAWNLITRRYPHIFFQGCVVHALNLLLKLYFYANNNIQCNIGCCYWHKTTSFIGRVLKLC